MLNIPSSLLLLALSQIHGHHAPGEVLHPLLVGQLLLGLGVQPPYLGRQRVLLLHLIRTVELLAGGIILPGRKDAVAQQLLARTVLPLEIQLDRSGCAGVGTESRS